ncbi:hypothetical protein GCM10027051_31380 [Niabella terrae]
MTKTTSEKIAELKRQIKQAEADQKIEAEYFLNHPVCSRLSVFDKWLSLEFDDFHNFCALFKDNEVDQENIKVGYAGEGHKDIPAPYRIDIKNDFHKRELQITFFKKGMEIKAEIDFKNLPAVFIDRFFVETKRKLYDTETHYINYPAHSRFFKDYRVQAYEFYPYGEMKMTNWYGGNKTLMSKPSIDNIIEYIKTDNL